MLSVCFIRFTGVIKSTNVDRKISFLLATHWGFLVGFFFLELGCLAGIFASDAYYIIKWWLGGGRTCFRTVQSPNFLKKFSLYTCGRNTDFKEKDAVSFYTKEPAIHIIVAYHTMLGRLAWVRLHSLPFLKGKQLDLLCNSDYIRRSHRVFS